MNGGINVICISNTIILVLFLLLVTFIIINNLVI